ncbi:MAG: hypothetical protein OJI67_08470, partial [Prosthecobacter sp.]|nr:hypothetical protein [Prosthecobacter sp.]
ENITKACATPAHLLPEQEVARLNFMICQQQTQDVLTTCKKDLLSQQSTLLARKLRLDTESNMLRHYEDNQKEAKRKQDLVHEQNALDEWVVQQGEPA